MGIAVICMRHTPESFLSCGVPDLQFDASSIDDNNFVLQLSYVCMYVCFCYAKRNVNAIVIQNAINLRNVHAKENVKWKRDSEGHTESVWEGGGPRGVCFMYCYIAHIAYTQRLPRACRHIKRTQNRVIQLQVTFK